MFKKILKNKNSLILTLSIIIFLLIFILSRGPITEVFFYVFNKKIQHIHYSMKNDPHDSLKKVFNFSDAKISKDILIVEIDDDTLEADNKENIGLGRFPFDRKAYIEIIENLNEAGAALIAFDIIFTDTTNEISDKALDNSINNAGNVIIGSYFNKQGMFINSIFDGIKTTGYFNPKIDELNNVVYLINPFVKSKGGYIYNNFSFSTLKAYYSFIYNKDYINFKSKRDNNFYYITPTKKIPLSNKGAQEVLINYIDYSKFEEANKGISFIDVYDEERFEGLKKKIDFKDKIVLIGATATGIKDVFYTPNGIEYGVYVHANMLNTVLTNNYLQYFNQKLELLLLFLLIILSVYFNLSRNNNVVFYSNVAIVSIFLIIYPFIIIYYTNLVINYPIELLFALIFSLIGTNLFKYLSENKNKKLLNKALSQYVSENIAREILSGSGEIELDGEEKNTTIFFSDIEGFTSISENFSPEELVTFLRKYLKEMSNIILDEDGFINKYEGDAIMALWGVFGEKEIDSYNGCLTALKQQKLLKELNKKWKVDGFSTIKARIGLHTGKSIVGNIGAEGRKMEFTALGDNVNLASRLEGVNKFYGTYICVSEDIYNLEKDNFEFRYLDKIRVKGKNIPIKIYELLSFKGELTKVGKEKRDLFIQGIDLYNSRDFKKAKIIFEDLKKRRDKPSNTYLDRCEKYIQNPPSSKWDGVWTMEEK